MVHGTPEKKISVMRDSMIGTGGIALFFIVGILTIAFFKFYTFNRIYIININM
nr:adenosylcobinamide-GDP ribazoletransferase [Methanobrevibacter arboriphilus]